MNILLALDLSEPEALVHYAEDLASRLEAELLVLHVSIPITFPPVASPMGEGLFEPYMYYDAKVLNEIEENRQHEFHEFMRIHFRRPARATLYESGEPADVILEDVETHDVGLVILGHRKHPMLERLLLGSVARKVMEKIQCPLLLFPIRDEPEE